MVSPAAALNTGSTYQVGFLYSCTSFASLPPVQIRIAALNAASSAADESQDPLRSSKSRTKEAQVEGDAASLSCSSRRLALGRGV